MLVLFAISADVAVVATLLALTAKVTLHALLYLAVSLIAVALVFYALAAPFVAALEVIVYAGAIVVLFIFAVMLLSPGENAEGMGPRRAGYWMGPAVLSLVLLGEIGYVVIAHVSGQAGVRTVPASEVGVALFGPYALGIELASMLLLVALIGVTHVAGHWRQGTDEDEAAGAGPIEVVGPAPAEAEVVGAGAGLPSRGAIGREAGS
jgi:NADH-quinone oxidoreductase subunit J